MQKSFLHRMREQLLAERVATEDELARLRSVATAVETQSEHAGLGNHMADDATDLFEQEKNVTLLHHTEHLLEKLNAALRRVDDGTYGQCESCGEPIDEARLETLPYAALCVRCKARQEKK